MSTHVSSSARSGGIGFLGALTVLFVGLKLTGYIAWSWWWILTPLWLPLAMLFAALLIGFLLFLLFD